MVQTFKRNHCEAWMVILMILMIWLVKPQSFSNHCEARMVILMMLMMSNRIEEIGRTCWVVQALKSCQWGEESEHCSH